MQWLAPARRIGSGAHVLGQISTLTSVGPRPLCAGRTESAIAKCASAKEPVIANFIHGSAIAKCADEPAITKCAKCVGEPAITKCAKCADEPAITKCADEPAITKCAKCADEPAITKCAKCVGESAIAKWARALANQLLQRVIRKHGLAQLSEMYC
ncbi:hypothetical protein TWF173_007922 [Orbilia oligospora]|nr:hypothetical protein TWF173_007922 [Orbilia oligospora]